MGRHRDIDPARIRWRGDRETRRQSLGPRVGTLRVPVPADLAAAGNGDREVLVADVLDDAAGNNATGRTARGLWWFAEPRDSALPAAKLTAQVVPASADNDGTSAEVRVTAGTLVRDLTLLVDALDPAAAVDSGLVTLFPGESHTFRISGVDGAVLTPAAVLAPEVARSGNQLVSR
ncbi:hypothetical protein [Arthrobacter sp. SD76]|uniref:hypothetical protein n=1 Tax=Arthrobacter sp. SD76 TaxID=3415007 RepID=UPI003C71A1FF